jgi:methyl-accepting chemotaxis protein
MINKKRGAFWRLKFSVRFLDFSIILLIALFFINFFANMDMVKRLETISVLPFSFVISQVSFLLVVIIFLINIMLFLHRGLGPVRRVESVIDRVLSGDYSLRINLRKKDILQSLAIKINQLIDLLESKPKS